MEKPKNEVKMYRVFKSLTSCRLSHNVYNLFGGPFQSQNQIHNTTHIGGTGTELVSCSIQCTAHTISMYERFLTLWCLFWFGERRISVRNIFTKSEKNIDDSRYM